MNKVHVIGIGFRPLDRKAADALLASDVVLANSRLLDVFRDYSEYNAVKDKIIVHKSVYEMLDYIRDNYRGKKIALLAAGDPMFFGIGRLVIERFGKDAVEIYPDLSSIQAAFSKIRETSQNALLVSLHGGPDPAKRRKLEYELDDIPSLLAEHDKIAILTDKVNNPARIAEVLASRYRKGVLPYAPTFVMYVCEKLGYPDEKITEGAPEDIAGMSFADPNVVIIKNTTAQQCNSAVGAIHELPLHVFGIKEYEFQHTKGLITKDEVRAVTIHKLRLPQKGVLWDIGAGSGSVSVEAARLSPDLKVFAVEKDEEQLNNIVVNINRFNITNIEVVKGEAPEALRALPSPDRVFIGGSGGRMDAIVNLISEKMGSGIIVINTITIETLNEAVHSFGNSNFIFELSEISVSRSKMVGNKRHMSALNPVFVITGRNEPA
ncbi:MAG: precorrin-6y C5,15-methyltransferase (decarboxylating) subunit CbiE [Nitrospirae bacterium]|nr:precorrin-6y C5,15-methyltransferase (decarboxylating) subunit CbiE [Nitrospirota bacterium]